MRSRWVVLGLAVMVFGIAGCASTPKVAKSQAGQILEGSMEEVQTAAVNALTVLGFD